jgi:hypothetical protein
MNQNQRKSCENSNVLMMISSSIPYSTHSVLESRTIVSSSVCLGVRRPAYRLASRFVGNSVHLIDSSNCKGNTERSNHLPRTPALDNTSEQDLLRVIRNKCDEIVYNTPEVSIWTSANHWILHPWTQWA